MAALHAAVEYLMPFQSFSSACIMYAGGDAEDKWFPASLYGVGK